MAAFLWWLRRRTAHPFTSTSAGQRDFVGSVMAGKLVLAVLSVVVCCLTALAIPGLQHPSADFYGPEDAIYRRMETLRAIPMLLKNNERALQKPGTGVLETLDAKAPGKAVSEYRKGTDFLRKQDYQQATEHYLKATTLYPPYAAAHNNLGWIYLQQGEYNKAREQLEAVAARNPRLAAPYLNLCRISLSLQDYPAAKSWADRARAIDPRNPEILTFVALSRDLSGDYQESIATAHDVHTLAHGDLTVIHTIAAAGFLKLGQLDGAQGEFQTYLQEDAKSAAADQARDILAKIQASRDQSKSAQFIPEPIEDGAVILPLPGEEEGTAPVFADSAVPSDAQPHAAPGPARPLPAHDRSARWSFTAEVDEVTVVFTADDRGRPISDLVRDDVMVKDDGKPPRTIVDFRNEAKLPLRLGLLIDTSSSVRERFDFEKRAAAKFLLSVLTGPSDAGFGGGFANHVRVTQDSTGDVEQLATGVERLQSGGGTALWDAVYSACAKLAVPEPDPVARMLVILTDGEDNASRLTLAGAADMAQRAGVLVYVISTKDAATEPQGRAWAKTSLDRALEDLAARTGGDAFFPGTLNNLDREFAKLQETIRHRYSISYRPAAFVADGRYRRIEIAGRRDGRKVRIHARSGYFARALEPIVLP